MIIKNNCKCPNHDSINIYKDRQSIKIQNYESNQVFICNQYPNVLWFLVYKNLKLQILTLQNFKRVFIENIILRS